MATISQRLSKWFSEPQDIVGLATWAGTAGISIAQYYASHNVSVPTLVGGIVAGLVAVIAPTGSPLAADVKALVVDGGNAAITKSTAEIPIVIADAEKVAADVTAQKGA